MFLKFFPSHRILQTNSFLLPLHPRAHVTFCEVESRVHGKCNPLLPHCWSKKHFLLENDSYIYGESEFTIDEYFQKNKLFDFVNHLGYVGGVVPSDEADKKHQKRFINVLLLMESRSREGLQIAFGKHKIIFIFHHWFPFVVIVFE